jgi:hypothetical protein
VRNWNLILSDGGLEIAEAETTPGRPGRVFSGLEAVIEAMRACGLRRKQVVVARTYNEIETMVSGKEG